MKRKYVLIAGLLAAVALLAEDRGRASLPTYKETTALPSIKVSAEAVEQSARMKTVDPEFAALEGHFTSEIEKLVQSLNGRSAEESEATQRQIIALKNDLRLARFELALKRVIELGDQDVIARISAEVDALKNPVVLQAVTADRDPITGEARVGGAK